LAAKKKYYEDCEHKHKSFHTYCPPFIRICESKRMAVKTSKSAEKYEYINPKLLV
jgi:hypothetical protein